MASGTEVTKLFVTVDAKLDLMQRDLLKAQRDVQKFAGKASSSTDKMAREMKRDAEKAAKSQDKLGRSLKGAAKAAAGAAAAYVGFSAVKDAIKTTENLAIGTKRLATLTGMETKEASRWVATAKVRNVESKALNIGFITLAKNVKGAADGSKSAVSMFDKLGISQRQLKQGDLTSIMLKTSDAFHKMGGGADRTAIAAKLFGRQTQTLLPLMKEGSGALKEQLALSDKYGTTMDKNQVKKALEAVRAQREMNMAMDGVKIAFAQNVLPALTSAGLAVGQFISDFRTGAGTAGDIKQVFVDSFNGIKAAVEFLRPVWSAIGVGAVAAFNGIRSAVGPTITGIKAGVAGLVTAFNAVSSWISSHKQDWQGFFDAAKIAIAPFVIWLKVMGTTMLSTWRAVWEPMKALAAKVLGIVATQIRAQLKIIDGIIKIFGGIFTGDFGRMWAGVKQVLGGVWAGIKNLITAPFRLAGPVLRVVLAGIKGSVSGFVGGIIGVLGGLASGAKNAVVSGVRGALNGVVSFLNAAIDVINKIPFVEIGHVGKIGGGGGGGGIPREHKGRATGGLIDKPGLMVGEQAPMHNEYVIATNPAYKKRNLGLWAEAGSKLGVPGLAGGGIVGDALSGVGSGAKSVAGAVGGAASSLNPTNLIKKLPKPSDYTPDWLDGFGGHLKDKAVDYIKDKAGGLLGGGGGGAGSTTGLVAQVKRAIAFAKSHGWHGGITSGFRSRAKQEELWANRGSNPFPVAPPGTSMHERGLAIDVSDREGFARAMAIAPPNAKLYSKMASDPIHFSTTGFKKGGIWSKAGITVGASMYGGGGDPSSGVTGYKGDNLNGTNTYAELGMGHNLGGLPYKQPLSITYGGKTQRGFKRDIGAGGGNVSGHRRDIDLWHQLASKLGFSGLGLVRVSANSDAGKGKDAPVKFKKGKSAGKIGRKVPGMPSSVGHLAELFERQYPEMTAARDNVRRTMELSNGLDQPEIDSLVGSQQGIVNFLLNPVVAASRLAMEQLAAAVAKIDEKVAALDRAIGRDTERLKKLRGKKHRTKSDNKEIDYLTDHRRSLTERRDKFAGRRKDYTDKLGELNDSKSRLSANGLLSAISDEQFNLADLLGTKPTPADADGGGSTDSSTVDPAIALRQQLGTDALRNLQVKERQYDVFSRFFLPSFASGTPFVKGDKVAQLHHGEAVFPKNENPFTMGGGGGSVVEVHVSADKEAFIGAVEVVIDGKKQEIASHVSQTLGRAAARATPRLARV